MIAELPIPLQKKLTRLVSQCSIAWQLIEPDDRIMVAFSGGKDSLLLIHLLESVRRIVPFKFDIGVFHLNQSAPDFPAQQALLALQNEGLHVWHEDLDTASILSEKIPPGDSPCGLCSRLRRGIIYTQATTNRYIKIALGHHRDDAIETFLMNAMFNGQLKSMPAKLLADNAVNVVIRPMLYIPEDLLIEAQKYLTIPVSEQTFCTRGRSGERFETKQLLKELERKNPNAKGSLMRALHNVVPSHLLDARLLKNFKDNTHGDTF
ncbi:MAG: tRNA 2-thiocytidine(32) synthetase TtcA [Proteobacteria bacterium]|nr:tRNA 2-thiocytidine(32) synthetase TtcA [Pseudomonadota bacterium]